MVTVLVVAFGLYCAAAGALLAFSLWATTQAMKVLLSGDVSATARCVTRVED